MSDLVLVRAEGAVHPQASSTALRVTANQVVPALRGVVGASLVLPAVMVVREHVDGHGGSPDGQVPATVDERGLITSIGDPIVVASDDEAHLAFVIGHELAHYHELSLRKQAALAIPSLRACWLWSEYYAQRVVCAAGLMDERLHRDLPEAKAAEQASSDDDDDGASWSYMMAFVKGQYDVDPACLDRFPSAQRKILGILLKGMKTTALDDAVRAFPHWSLTERKLVEGFFEALRVSDPARQRRRRQRRRARKR
ncbi:MAG: hypothetical protein ABIO70_14675 [Pseudomonadota bacterium]